MIQDKSSPFLKLLFIDNMFIIKKSKPAASKVKFDAEEAEQLGKDVAAVAEH